jgi:hypothetical protein
VTFRRVRACTRVETTELANYLARTPVAGYAPPLRVGTIVASVVEVVGRPDLGETWSIFGNLGGVTAPMVGGLPKFVVREIHEVLNRPDCIDARSRLGLETVIVDGNKRAAAIYELAGSDVVLSAFLIESAPGYPPLAMP